MVQVHGDRSAAASVPRSSTTAPTATAAARRTVPGLPWRRCPPFAAASPEVPIDYKLAVRQEDPHYGNAGVLESELPVFVPLLEQAGVTSFHVTLANHSELSDTIPPQKPSGIRR